MYSITQERVKLVAGRRVLEFELQITHALV